MNALLAPRDARTFWASRLIPSDQFLLYCFDHGDALGPSAADVADLVFARAPSIPDLRIRVAPALFDLERPAWAPCEVVDVREGVARTWDAIPGAVARLFARQLDAVVAPWRLHVFPRVAGAPGCAGPATVVVLQIAHCLADGRRSAEIARALLSPVGAVASSRPELPAAVRAIRGLVSAPIDVARTVIRGTRVQSARDRIADRTACGELPAPAPGCPITPLNARPDTSRDVRMLVRDRTGFGRAATVTVGALTAVSLAVERYLRLHGAQVPDTLCAEVMVAREPNPGERNAFGNVSVPLLPGVPVAERPVRIAAGLASARARAADPLWRIIAAPDEVTPAPLARLGVDSFDPDLRPETMAGATVVSSVYRGLADLDLVGGRAVFTAGFPALSPAMGLTHGVHGLGDTVTLSVTSSRTAVPDPDAYAGVLDEALREVAQLR